VILFNFSSGTVPSQFKLASVLPVFKKGTQTLCENYRPISLLSIFNHIQERLMYNRLISYIHRIFTFAMGNGWKDPCFRHLSGWSLIPHILKVIFKGSCLNRSATRNAIVKTPQNVAAAVVQVIHSQLLWVFSPLVEQQSVFYTRCHPSFKHACH
jgi:hypothetical protein